MPNSASPSPEEEHPRTSFRYGLALLLIVGLATALRLYRLGEQGVWIDEYVTATFFRAPNLETMAPIARFFLPENMPLYYVLFYLWAQLTNPLNSYLLRLLSVIIGVASIPLIYAYGRRVFGPGAGLIAALLVAISPFHIHFAQGLRYNVFLDPLSLLAMYGLLKATQDGGRRWWVLHFLANIALLWTHPFVGSLFAAQGLFLLVWHCNWRTRILWGTAHALAIAVAAAWLYPSLALMNGAGDDEFMQIPRVSSLAADVLADDALMLNDPFAFQGNTWPWLPERLQQAYVMLHPFFDYALILLGALVALWAGVVLWRRKQPGVTLALAWWLVPPLVLLFGSFMLRPMLLPRYTCFASLGLYVLLGGAICAIPVSSARVTALCTVLAVYAYQLGLMLPAPTRTDWPSVVHAIVQEAAPGDPVYVTGTWLSWEVFRFQAPRSLASMPVATLQGVVDVSDRQLHAPEAPPEVWAVFHPFIFAHAPLAQFEAQLESHGLAHQHRFYPGMNGIHLYRITRAARTGAEHPKEWTTLFDSRAFLEAMNVTSAEKTDRGQMEAALRASTEFPILPTPLTMAYTALVLAYNGEADLALAAARASTKMEPAYSFGHFVLAIAWGSKGDAAGCAAAYAQAVETDPIGYFKLFESAIQHLYVEPNLAKAREALQELNESGAYVPPVCLRDAGLLPMPGRGVE